MYKLNILVLVFLSEVKYIYAKYAHCYVNPFHLLYEFIDFNGYQSKNQF